MVLIQIASNRRKMSHFGVFLLTGVIATTPSISLEAQQTSSARILCEWANKIAVDGTNTPQAINQSFASGFFIQEGVVTAGHAIPHVEPRDWNRLSFRCEFANGVSGATLIKLDRERDLALLKLNVVPAGVTPLKMHLNNLNVNDQIKLIYPKDNLGGGQNRAPFVMVPQDGLIQQIIPRGNLPGFFGFVPTETILQQTSGSPIVKNNEVVGITLGLQETIANQVSQKTVIALDHSELRQFLAIPQPRISAKKSWVELINPPGRTKAYTVDVGAFALIDLPNNFVPPINPFQILGNVPAANNRNQFGAAGVGWKNFQTLQLAFVPIGGRPACNLKRAESVFPDAARIFVNNAPGTRYMHNPTMGYTTVIPEIFGPPKEVFDPITSCLTSTYPSLNQVPHPALNIVSRFVSPQELAPLAQGVAPEAVMINLAIKARRNELRLYLEGIDPGVPLPGETPARVGFLGPQLNVDGQAFSQPMRNNPRAAFNYQHYVTQNGNAYIVLYFLNGNTQRMHVAWFESPNVLAPEALNYWIALLSFCG